MTSEMNSIESFLLLINRIYPLEISRPLLLNKIKIKQNSKLSKKIVPNKMKDVEAPPL